MRVRQYSWRHREEVRALLGRSGVLAEEDILGHLERLEGMGTMAAGAPVVGLVVQCTAYEMALGVAVAQSPSAASGACLLRLLVIDPENRRRGLGRALLEAAEKAARMRGALRLSVPVPRSADRPAADAFLHKLGYRRATAPASGGEEDSLYSKEL